MSRLMFVEYLSYRLPHTLTHPSNVSQSHLKRPHVAKTHANAGHLTNTRCVRNTITQQLIQKTQKICGKGGNHPCECSHPSVCADLPRASPATPRPSFRYAALQRVTFTIKDKKQYVHKDSPRSKGIIIQVARKPSSCTISAKTESSKCAICLPSSAH